MENQLYCVKPLEASPRTKPMQVLALGLSRSGTDSLREALTELGYRHVYHGFDVGGGDSSVRKAWSDLGEAKWRQGKTLSRADFEPLLSHCEAVTDQPCACFASELIEAYPEALVILNSRDVDEWYTSLVNTFSVLLNSWSFKYLSYFETSLYWRMRCFMLYENYFFQGSLARHAKRVQRDHYAMVRGAVPPEKLLQWKVQDGWDPLCEFLGKPTPKSEFPVGNTPAELWARVAKMQAAAQRRAYINLTLTTSSVVLVLGVVANQLWRVWR